MRFFDGNYNLLGEADAAARRTSYYERHLPQICPRLPPDFARFLRLGAAGTPELKVHDGRLVALDITRAEGRAVLTISVGDLQSGYSLLTLTFFGSLRLPNVIGIARAIAASGDEFLHDEADVSPDGVPTYRLSTTSDALTLEFHFTDFSFRTRPVATRFEPSIARPSIRELP